MGRTLTASRRRAVAALGVAGVISVVWGWTLRAAVESAPNAGWVTDAPVYASASSDIISYLGGAFRYIGEATDEGENFLDANGALLRGCAIRTGPADGERPAVVPDSIGGLFVQVPALPGHLLDGAGPFNVDSGRSFVRVRNDCTFERGFMLDTFVPGDLISRGSTIARVGGTLYVGGARSVGFGDRLGRVVAFDATSGQRIGAWEFPQYDRVIVEGASAGNVLVASLPVRNDTTGTMPVGLFNPATSGFVPLATVAASGFVKVIGAALYVSPGAGQPLRVFDVATGAEWTTWSRPQLTVRDIEVAEGRVYVAGSGLGRTGVLALTESTGTLVETFQPQLTTDTGAPADIERLAIFNGRLIVRGRNLRVANGAPRYLLAAVSLSTGAALPWAPLVFAPTADGIDLVPAGNRLYIGRVWSNQAHTRIHLAAVNVLTGELLPFDSAGPPAAPLLAPVTALSANAQHLYAGSATGQIRRFSLTTGLPDAWAVATSSPPGTSPVVAALAATSTAVYAGGFFTGAATSAQPTAVARTHALAVNTNAATLLPWTPVVDAPGGTAAEGQRPIAAMASVGGAVVLGGRFSSVGGETRTALTTVDAVTGVPGVPALTLPEDHVVTGMAVEGNTAYFVGRDGTDGEAAPLIGAADVNGGEVSIWAQPSNASSSGRVAVFEERVYSGPEWDPAAGVPTTLALSWRHPEASEAGVFELDERPDGDVGPVLVRHYSSTSGGSPRAPRDVTVHYADHEVFLTWSPPAVGDVLSYVVRAGSFSGMSNLVDYDTGSTVTSLLASAREGLYYVRLHARGPDGLSPPSRELVFALTTNGCNAPPLAPGTLSGVGGDVGASLTWGLAIGATSYVVSAGSVPGAEDRAVLNVGRRTNLVTAAPPGTYFVRVAGTNNCGRGPASNEVVLQVGAPPPGPPRNLQVTVSAGIATLTWDPPVTGGPVSFYRLEAGSAPGLANLAVTNTGATGFVAPPVVPGVYHVRVRAGSASGLGAPTPDVVVTISPPLR